MAQTNEKEIPWQVNFPDEDRVTRHFKTSLVDICCGNERIADALDYFVYTASWEVKNKGLPKGGKIAKITRTHKEIMERLQFNTSRRSLIHYLDLFNEWGYVLSQPYQRDFEVNFEAIQVAINDPSKRPQKSTRSKVKSQEDGDEKGCNVADLHTCTEGCEHAKKVAILHTKVADLQQKVATLHKKVESLATLQPAFEALVRLVEDHFSEPTVITSILPLLTGKEDSASAFADRNPLTPILSKISLLDDNVIRVAFDEWQTYRPQQTETSLLPVTATLTELSQFKVTSEYIEDDTNYYTGIPEIQPTTSTGEKPQLHRLTSTPEPLAQQNVSTDESHARIERETENGTPSLPVIDASIAEVTHVDARKDGDSYSPQSTAKTPTPTTEQSEATETPVASGKGSGKRSGGKSGNKKKQEINLEEVEPVPPPEQPAEDMPWNAKKLLLWADYFRGYTLPVSNHPNSRNYKAEQAAIALIRRGAEERQFLAVMRFMRGVNLKLEEDLEFRDDWWPANQTADVWNAEAHFDEMLKKARQTLKNRKQNAQAKAGVASATMTPQTRQPSNVIEAPKGWTARRTAEGGK